MATTVPAVSRAQMLPAQMTAMIRDLMPDIRTLLPPDIEYEKFRAALWLELTGRPQLKECTMDSIRASAIKAATLGLLPGRDCHLLPFKNKGRYESQCITNYFGLVLTLERTGKLAKAFAHPVYEGDEFMMNYFADDFTHVPYMVRGKEPGKILFYYGAVKLLNGTVHLEPMSLSQIDAIRKRAPAHEAGPWVTDTIEMSRKTALRRVTKFVRLTPQQEALLEEEEEIARADIPPERHAQNIVDLFGDGNGGYSHQPQGSLWRDTVEAHWQRMPEPLKEQCRAALENAETPEAEGFQLASQCLDVVDNHGSGK